LAAHQWQILTTKYEGAKAIYLFDYYIESLDNALKNNSSNWTI